LKGGTQQKYTGIESAEKKKKDLRTTSTFLGPTDAGRCGIAQCRMSALMIVGQQYNNKLN